MGERRTPYSMQRSKASLFVLSRLERLMEEHMKKLIVILAVLIAICLLMYFSVCNDRSECVCSVLTTEDTKHPITSILDSVWDPDSASEETFTRLLTTCKHGKRVSLTVFTDEGYFAGRIVK